MRAALVTLLGAAAFVAVGCGAVPHMTAGSGDPARGKPLFKTNCGSCHTLAAAGTTGTIGPNLDDAFLYDKKQGFHISTIQDVVRGQIAYANSSTGAGPGGKKPPGVEYAGMPDNILTGQDAKDVAAYVAKCAAVPDCKPGNAG